MRITSLFIVCILLSSLIISDVFGAEKKVRFTVDGVTWMSAAAEAEAIPKRLPGVLSSEVFMGFSGDTVVVVFDDEKVSIETIRNALNKQNFTVKKEPEIIQ